MTRPEWWSPSYPELRDGPPWVMQEMVEAEPGLVRPLFDRAAEAGPIAQSLRAAAGAELVVTGCGTSLHAAQAVALQLTAALGHGPERVVAREAFEAALEPQTGGFCLGISHEGQTEATRAALRAASEAGAATALITACPDQAGGVADLVLATPLRDRSWCHTVGYLSPVLAGAAIAARLGAERPRPGPLAAGLSEVLARRDEVAAMAVPLSACSVLVTCGSGIDRPSARELALKVEEGVRRPAAMRELESMLHGHLAGCDESVGLVLLLAEPRTVEERAERASALLAASRRIGLTTAAILSPAADALVDDALTTAGRVVVPEVGDVPPLVAALALPAVALQLLTLELAREAGVNPDLIRREQAPWREAAAIAER